MMHANNIMIFMWRCDCLSFRHRHRQKGATLNADRHDHKRKKEKEEEKEKEKRICLVMETPAGSFAEYGNGYLFMFLGVYID